MHRMPPLMRSRWLFAALGPLALLAAATAQDRRIADFVPDPASVARFDRGWSYPQAGFRVVHIEGAPLERGRQHGRLLAPEITDFIATLSSMRSTDAPLDAWRDWRTMAQAWFLPGFDAEWREEMRGIAEGAAAAGAVVGTRPVDFLDIVTVNCAIELDFLENALEATPTGADPQVEDHCSAFAATGKATADGHVVFGHITMWSCGPASRFFVWLDVQPAAGHRIVLQTFPGGIWSGMDYYQSAAGLLLTETTIGQTRFERGGKPLAQRARQAMQSANTIDEAVKILSDGNNGLYTNEWLLADVKTDEIAMFELGTRKSRLWRSGKDEWFGGTTGFYWGCNNAKDLAVRLETIGDPGTRTRDLTWRPSDRDLAWLKLYETHQGKIDAEFGFRAFTTPPLCAARSLDAKFTTAALAKNLDCWAIFGPPIGPAWLPTEADLRRNPRARALIGNDWSMLGRAKPVPAAASPANGVCLPPAKAADAQEPSWSGTVLAQGDGDVWLPAAIAAARSALSDADPDVAAFGARSRATLAERRLGRRLALADLKPDVREGDWYEVAAGKGALVLFELRSALGPDRFDQVLREFLARHALERVTTADFIAAAETAAGKKLAAVFDRLKDPAWPDLDAPSWSITGFESEPERALMVYGTQREARANREAAEILQRLIAARWHNFQIPIRSDLEVGDKDLEERHLVLVGRPACNAIAARLARHLPVRFGDASFALGDAACGRPDAAVVAAGDLPGGRWSVVLYAGLSAEATWRLARRPRDAFTTPCQALLFPAGEAPRPWVRPR